MRLQLLLIGKRRFLSRGIRWDILKMFLIAILKMLIFFKVHILTRSLMPSIYMICAKQLTEI